MKKLWMARLWHKSDSCNARKDKFKEMRIRAGAQGTVGGEFGRWHVSAKDRVGLFLKKCLTAG